MQPPNFQSEILNNLKSKLDSSSFLSEIFSKVRENRKRLQEKDGDNLKRICAEEYDEISLRVDATGIQESVSVRNVLKTRRLANLIVNDKGEINVSLLPSLIKYLKNYQFSFGKNRTNDALREAHIIKVLTQLTEKKELLNLLKTISKPHQHPLADQMIRETLQLESGVAVTDAHAKRAVLSSWLTYLRQNVGSCFATAPAIIVHDEQPELFLKDMRELLATGRLKRIFGGVEHQAPICDSWGASDLRKPFLLSYEEDSEKGVWNSPGLIMALDAVSFFEMDNEVQKIQKLKEVLRQVFPEWNPRQNFLITTIEEILKRILLKHLTITEKELNAYLERPKEMFYSNVLFHASHKSSHTNVKSDLYLNYLSQIEQAQASFKGLSDNALLKVWEFTLASFAETKADFTRWNLYASLGFQPNEKGGIGEVLYQSIKQKLDHYNQKVSDVQFEYEHLFAQVKQLETRIRHAADEKEAQWIRVEYQSKASEFYTLEEIRNKAHEKASIFARLFDILLDQYDKLFPNYFQEVYDPDLNEIRTGFYDDSPAGFRLLYKHGRDNTSQWSRIRTPHDYIDSLVKFFTVTENTIATLDVLQPIHDDISDIVTQVVHLVRTDLFLENAFHRMALSHRVQPIANPLENLEKITIKPWAYISGGTMNTLLGNYFRREDFPSEVTRWVENPMELLLFFIDTLKQVPFKEMEEYLKNPQKSMLIHSPTHAFLLKPGYEAFRHAWQSEQYTYTWVRDELIAPMVHSLDDLFLNDEMQGYLIEKLALLVPKEYRSYFKKVFSNMPHVHGTITPSDFRFIFLDALDHERGLHYQGSPLLLPDHVDAMLYEHLPFFSRYELSKNVELIIEKMVFLTNEQKNSLKNTLSLFLEKVSFSSNIISSKQLQEIAAAVFCFTFGMTSFSIDIVGMITKICREEKLAMPQPITFADSNWVQDTFAFLINPGTQQLELWRVDIQGRQGAPMSTWKEWLNGTHKDRLWGIYPHFHQYQASTSQNLYLR